MIKEGMTYREIRTSDKYEIEKQLGTESGPQGTTVNAATTASVDEQEQISGTTVVREQPGNERYRVTFRNGEVERVEAIES